ncbi:hypothetical protein BHM03_00042415, partial [Ensete ventricosum]
WMKETRPTSNNCGILMLMLWLTAATNHSRRHSTITDLKNGCVFHRYHPDQMAIAAAAPGPSVSSYVPGWLA